MKTTWKGLPLIEALKIELEHEKDQRNTEGLKLIIKHIEQQQEVIDELTQCLRLRVNCLSHGDLISQEKREMDLLDKIRRQALAKIKQEGEK